MFLLSIQPVLDLHAWHVLKMLNVVCDHCKPCINGLPCNNHVELIDGLALLSQLHLYLCIVDSLIPNW